MIVIDDDDNLVEVEGTLDQLCGDAATLCAIILASILKSDDMGDSKYDLTEQVTEAMIRTVMNAIKDEDGIERIVNACRTIGITGKVSHVKYVIREGRGVVS